MYYSNGNYEAFARPRKLEGVEQKSAYIVGSGLAGLAAACFLVRDAQMPGSNIHIFEADPIAGGALDGAFIEEYGYLCRGGREMESHMECLWDLFRSIPSLEEPDYSVLDEFYWLNKEDPNISLERDIYPGGKSATDSANGFSPRVSEQLQKIMMTPERFLEDKKITDFFNDEFFNTPYWLHWSTMFAFQKWHSALEFKLYNQRFIHYSNIEGGLAGFRGMKFMRYNQYESFVMPLQKYLEANNVDFIFSTTVTDIIFDCSTGKKVAEQIVILRNGKEEKIDLTENDYVFTTLGSNVDKSSIGKHNTPPAIDFTPGAGRSWELWKKIAAQNPSFGRPEKFCGNIHDTLFASATVTIDDKIGEYVENICKRPLAGGKTVTGGIISVKNSKWMMSFTFDRQPHFASQPEGKYVGWLYALNNYVPGDYIKKPMMECTGLEICEEWLYLMGVPEDQIVDLATNHANVVPCVMPYVTTYFMPRAAGDRPKVVPDGAVNFAFLGEHVETPRDVVFTTEYAVRTGMEAVYTLLGVDRGVPEVYGSYYDIRHLLPMLKDGVNNFPIKLPAPIKDQLMKKIKNTDIEDVLKEYGLM